MVVAIVILSLTVIILTIEVIQAHKRIDKLTEMSDFHSNYIDATSTLALDLSTKVKSILEVFNEAAEKLDKEKSKPDE